jgi:hypothetical protein
MKKLLISATLLFALLTTGWAQQNDLEQIKTVINKAYIEGIHNNGDLSETRKGFHPGFDLLMLQNNQLVKLPIYNWIESTERARKENPDAKRPQTTVNYVNIDITGTAAVAKIELLREGKLIFTDYLMLYRFEEGWRIVGKTYFRHP